jgi:hypothetical protein
MLNKLLEKIVGDKKPKAVAQSVSEVRSAVKTKSVRSSKKETMKNEDVVVQHSGKVLDHVGYFGATGSNGTSGSIGVIGSIGATGSVGYFGTSWTLPKNEKIDTVTIEEYREPTYPPADAYTSYPAVMFHTTDWLESGDLVPIGKSRYTGYPIYRYLGKGPGPLEKFNHHWEELI